MHDLLRIARHSLTSATLLGGCTLGEGLDHFAEPDAGLADAGQGGGADSSCSAPIDLGRGHIWQRKRGVPVSGWVEQMKGPSPAQVDQFFDHFAASAVALGPEAIPDIETAWASAEHPSYGFLLRTHPDGTVEDASGQPWQNGWSRPGRIGYQIGPTLEPGDSVDTVLDAASAVRQADGQGLIVASVSEDAAADRALLERLSAAGDIDVLSLGLVDRAEPYAQLAAVRGAAVTTGKPYWRDIDAWRGTEDARPPSRSDMRFDAFVGLLYGFTGHSWSVYQTASLAPSSQLFVESGSFAADTTLQYDIAAELNRQLAIVNRTMPRLWSTGVRYQPSQESLQPEGSEPWAPGAGGDRYIRKLETISGAWHEVAIGFFTDDCGDGYVMLHNPHRESGPFPLNLDTDITVRIHFDFAGADAEGVDASALLVLDHLSGYVDPYILSELGTERIHADFQLAPGDIRLFKYHTGRPFAGVP